MWCLSVLQSKRRRSPQSSRSALHPECGREHEFGAHFAAEHFLQFAHHGIALEPEKERVEIGWRQHLHRLQRRLHESALGINDDALLGRDMHAQSGTEIEDQREGIGGQARHDPHGPIRDHPGQVHPLAFGDKDLRRERRRAGEKFRGVGDRGIAQQRGRFVRIICLQN